jgi:hypothetical protein
LHGFHTLLENRHSPKMQKSNYQYRDFSCIQVLKYSSIPMVTCYRIALRL